MVEVGEYIVGAFLKLEFNCDVVDYNVRVPGGGREGLNEIDVVGYSLTNREAYLCEVATHIRGLGYGNYKESAERIERKFRHQRAYAGKLQKAFDCNVIYEFWSPNVPKGCVVELKKIKGLQLIINGGYKKRIDALRIRAQNDTHDTGNPFFRILQILESVNAR
jgi:hypothetical protein